MSERREIERDGATPQKNSGRGRHQKGDAILGDYLVDYKETGKGVTVNRTMWAKVCTDAMRHKKEPVLKVVIGDGRSHLRLAVISWEEFEELRNYKIMYEAAM